MDDERIDAGSDTDGGSDGDGDIDDPSASMDPHTQRAAVRDGYDAMADAYRREREAGEPGELPAVESLLADLDNGDSVLDAGCGQGTPVLDRVPAGVDAVGVDLSASQLALAREATDAALVRGDVTRLPVAADAVDAVTALHSVIHVPLGAHPAVYREFARVLRPGGRLLVTAAPGEDGWSGTNDDWLDSGERMAWSFPGADRTRELLWDAGFRVTGERRIEETISDTEDTDGDTEGTDGDAEDTDGEGAWALLAAEYRGG